MPPCLTAPLPHWGAVRQRESQFLLSTSKVFNKSLACPLCTWPYGLCVGCRSTRMLHIFFLFAGPGYVENTTHLDLCWKPRPGQAPLILLWICEQSWEIHPPPSPCHALNCSLWFLVPAYLLPFLYAILMHIDRYCSPVPESRVLSSVALQAVRVCNAGTRRQGGFCKLKSFRSDTIIQTITANLFNLQPSAQPSWNYW